MVFFEDKMMYQLKGPVPAEEYTIPLGVADVKRAGSDITLVATSSMVHVALAAAESLEADGISAEVVDVRTTVPLDKQTLIESAKKTSRGDRHRRRLRALRRHSRDRLGDRRRRILLSRRAGKTHGRHGRAGAVLAGARRSDRADAGNGGRDGEATVQ